MEELKVSQKMGVISTNLEAIDKGLTEYLRDYEDYVVTEDSISDDKRVLADLRKLQTSLDDARKSVKREWEKPYLEFEEKCKKVIAKVDKPINLINNQLKVFDEKRVAEKLEHVKAIYSESIGELAEYLPFDKVFNKKWLNATYKDKDIHYDISEAKVKVSSDLDILRNLNSEIEDEILDIYRNNDNSLAIALKRNSDYISDKLKIQSQVQHKEEQKPMSEAMGTLNDMVEMVQTVKIIVSKSDLQTAKNALDFNEISYRVEGEN